MATLVDLLAAQLERPRDITVQVAEYLNNTYGVDRDAIGAFLTEQLPGLEDDDHDLILSPLFTPRLADQAIFAGFLGAASVPREEWRALIRQLSDRPALAHLVTIDGQVHTIALRDVILERYVHRLRLEGSIPEAVLDLLERVPPTEDRPLMKALARRAVWESGQRRNILMRYLTGSSSLQAYRLSDALYLLDIVESYKPADAERLLALIPPWQDRLRQEIDTASDSRTFFSAQTQAEHGGDRDHRRPDEKRLEEKREESALLSRLQRILA
jgi:hypothetical protein